MYYLLLLYSVCLHLFLKTKFDIKLLLECDQEVSGRTFCKCGITENILLTFIFPLKN